MHRNDSGICVMQPPSTIPSFPNFKKPSPVGFYSIDTNLDFQPNDRELRYLRLPAAYQFPLNLNEGLSLAIKKDIGIGDIDNILKFLNDHYKRIFLTRNPPEFVAFRGLLRRIMCTPYDTKQDWCVRVTRFNGTFYLSERETDQKKLERLYTTEQQRTFCAYGFKFEQYCLSKCPSKNPDVSEPVDERAEFACVFQTRLESLNLLYSAEMDGIMSHDTVSLDYKEPNLGPLKFVEMKVREGNVTDRKLYSFLRYKIRDWWCQSFLVGIENIYVGFRNDRGFVQNIECMKTSSLPTLNNQNFWDPSVCFNFLKQFLLTLKSIMGHVDSPFTMYEFCFNSTTGRISYECFTNKERSFLPDWYMRRVNESVRTKQ
ncbi:decapping and exoribonuclease protein Rai1-like isoform 1-T2 [Glossina fuscipes fuscipes]